MGNEAQARYWSEVAPGWAEAEKRTELIGGGGTRSHVQAAIEAALNAEGDDGQVHLSRGVHVVTADT